MFRSGAWQLSSERRLGVRGGRVRRGGGPQPIISHQVVDWWSHNAPANSDRQQGSLGHGEWWRSIGRGGVAGRYLFGPGGSWGLMVLDVA
jgi:fructosamine-3-kinase